MNILLIGSGGRECALAWKMSQSSLCRHLYIAPGNPGTALYGLNVPLKETDFEGLKRFVLENDIEMMVVGPEVPLAAGLADFFKHDGLLGHLRIIGPAKAGAMLESSKDFAKTFMIKHDIPTAAFASFSAADIEKGFAFLETLRPPYVLKADGLAAGKGVVICQCLDEARSELHQMLIREKFGSASSRVVIEEFLYGMELSVFVLTDGKNYVILPEAKDYKRIGDGDQGSNTGGMGAVSPVGFANKEFMTKVEERIIKPTIAGLQKDNIPYCGFIFFGLINCSGDPFVIEYNVRMGDPETQAVLPRIKNDLIQLFMLAAESRLNEASIEIDEGTSLTVVLASGGYPEAYQSGKSVTIGTNLPQTFMFQAGTSIDVDNQLTTAGGRVIAVTSLGNTLGEAIAKAYQQVEVIDFEGAYYRRDIGQDLLAYTELL